MSQTTNSATSIGTVPPGGSLAATFARAAAPSVPNKPMVPTALTTTEERSPGSMRQHIGEPLGYGAAGDSPAILESNGTEHSAEFSWIKTP